MKGRVIPKNTGRNDNHINTTKGGNDMAAVKNEVVNNSQTEDVREYLELLKALTDTEKAQVKGIMVGMQLTKQLTAQTA